MSNSADIEIRLFNVSGDQIWRKKIHKNGDGGMMGFNSVPWDGRNDFNESVANGVYIAFLRFVYNEKSYLKKIKVAVLK